MLEIKSLSENKINEWNKMYSVKKSLLSSNHGTNGKIYCSNQAYLAEVIKW